MTASVANSFIAISPDELLFPFEVEKQTFSDLKILNNTESHIAFKMKANSDEKYFAIVETDVIHPWHSLIIRLNLRAQQEYPPDMQCKDKILIQFTTVNPNNIVPDEFPPDTLIEEVKLKVVYISPNNSPPENTGELKMIQSRIPHKNLMIILTGHAEKTKIS